jgi:FlaA1/EpsC-like NDP-sugar epimerase
MSKNRDPLILFLFDLTAIYLCFLLVYVHYTGWVAVSLKALMLMVGVAGLWFIITINTGIANMGVQSPPEMILTRILTAYSVLSAGIIAAVGIFGDFRHNDKLVLYPLLFAFLISVMARALFLVLAKYVARRGFRQKNVLVVGGWPGGIARVKANPTTGPIRISLTRVCRKPPSNLAAPSKVFGPHRPLQGNCSHPRDR